MLQLLPTPVAASVGVTVMADRDGQVSKPVADDVAHDHDDDDYYVSLLIHLVYNYYRLRNNSSFLAIVAVVLSVRFVLQQPQQHRRCRHRLAE